MTNWPHRLQRIIPLLVCPNCRGKLEEEEAAFRCESCQLEYPIRDGKIYFIEPFNSENSLDAIKSILKRFLGSAYYTVGVRILAPSYPFNYRRAIRRWVDPRDKLVVDLGCGNHRVDEDIVTLDGAAYNAVDIIARVEALPFRDASIDTICSRSVLEHVLDLTSAVKEIERCTRNQGIGIHFIPLMYPFHASPDDYHRLTHVGQQRLFTSWSLLEQRSATGPISLFLICLNEFIASLLSFGSERVKAPVYLFCCLVTFPIKFLDAPFVGRKQFIGLAPTILTVVRKP